MPHCGISQGRDVYKIINFILNAYSACNRDLKKREIFKRKGKRRLVSYGDPIQEIKRLFLLVEPGMRLFETLGYWDSLGTFFFTFKTLDTFIGMFVFGEVTVKKSGCPGIVIDHCIVIIFQYRRDFDTIWTWHAIFAICASYWSYPAVFFPDFINYNKLFFR